MEYDCFISYASADLRTAEAVHTLLAAEGLRVWFDKVRLRPGCDWHREIEAGCESSRVILPLLTPNWKWSKWTKYETYGAESIIPLVVGPGVFDQLCTPPLLQWQAYAIEFHDDAYDSWTKLFGAIHELISRPRLDTAERARRTAHLRFRPTVNFVGRDRDMEKIHEQFHVAPSAALTQGRVQAIVALGGVGKTTLARMYAEKFWRCYREMFWVDARLGYEAEFTRVYHLLFPESAQSALQDVGTAQKARRALVELENRFGPRLLIIDNAEDEDSAAPWIPKTGATHTLLTSRYSHWEAIPTCQIDVLAPGPARALLLARSGYWAVDAMSAEKIAACDRLADNLGYLPLALEQAAAYMRQQGASFGFADYLRLFAEAERELLLRPARGTTEYPMPVFTTWRTTVDRLPAGARALLRIAAFMAPAEIPFWLWLTKVEQVEQLAAEFPTTAALSVEENRLHNEVRVRSWRAALANYSMVTNTDGGGFAVHSLVQAVEREQLDADAQRRWTSASIQLLDSAFGNDPDDARSSLPLGLLFPHARAAIEHGKHWGLVALTSSLMAELAKALASRSRYSEAERLLREALALDEAEFGREHSAIARDMTLLGSVVRISGRRSESEPFLLDALRLAERATDPATLAPCLGNLALLFLESGRSEEAEPLLRRLLAIHEEAYGPDHYLVSKDLDNLARVLQDTGRLVEAEELFLRSLAICRRQLGAEHREVAGGLVNLATLLARTERYAEAEDAFRQALAIVDRSLEPGHPDLAAARSGLAWLLKRTNRFVEAESLNRQAVEILFQFARATGEQHPYLRQVLGNHIGLLRAIGRTQDDLHQEIAGLTKRFAVKLDFDPLGVS